MTATREPVAGSEWGQRSLGALYLQVIPCGSLNPKTHLIRQEGYPTQITKHHLRSSFFSLGPWQHGILKHTTVLPELVSHALGNLQEK